MSSPSAAFGLCNSVKGLQQAILKLRANVEARVTNGTLPISSAVAIPAAPQTTKACAAILAILETPRHIATVNELASVTGRVVQLENGVQAVLLTADDKLKELEKQTQTDC